MRMEETGENERGGRLRGRLQGVRRRKRARRGFECEVVALKMRLVRTKSCARER